MVKIELKKFQVDPYDAGKPFHYLEVQSVDVTEYLIDGSLRGDFRVEFTQPFDMGSSGMSFELGSGASSCGLLSLNYLEGYIICCQVWNNGVADFIGGLDVASSSYDETEQKYVLNFVDMFKFLFDAHVGYEPGDIEYIIYGQPTTKLSFLTAYNTFFKQTYTTPRAIVSIGDAYAGIHNPAYNDNCKDMYVNDFLEELIKHHSALMYMNGDGNLVFCDRGLGLPGIPKDITASILEESLSRGFAFYPIYNSVLINVFGAWELNDMGVYQQWEGWALIYHEDGVYKETLGINADLSNIPPKFKNSYIDLRQYLNHPREYSFTYNQIFGARERTEVLASFSQLIRPRPSIKCVYNGTDLSLLQKVVVNSEWDGTGGRDVYIIYNMEKDYTNDTSALELIRA